MAAKDVAQKLHSFDPNSEWNGLRLKEAVRRAIPELASRGSFLVIRNGLVTVNGQPAADADQELPPGARLAIDLRHGMRGRGESKHPRLHERMKVLHDDNHLIVVAKNPGTLVQKAKEDGGKPRGAPLTDLLIHYWRSKGLPTVEPQIIQRLDVETSGLLVIAKNPRAARQLQDQFKPPRQLRREYLAIVTGSIGPDRGRWRTFLGRGPSGLRQSLAESAGRAAQNRDLKDAITLFSVEKRLPGATLLRLKLETGRTHQIRIHCAEAGHPLLGDDLYWKLSESIYDRLAKGKFEPRSAQNPAMEALRLIREDGLLKPPPTPAKAGRVALHSAKLSFIHPGTSKRVTFTEPPPKDFEAIIQEISERSTKEKK